MSITLKEASWKKARCNVWLRSSYCTKCFTLLYGK